MTAEEFKNTIDKARRKDIKPFRYKLKWSCGKHNWEATYENMKCTATFPYCKSGYYESHTRRLFKKTFGLDFQYTKTRDVLKDGSHGNSHFDGYNEFIISGKKVKLAFEFNGHQHYE